MLSSLRGIQGCICLLLHVGFQEKYTCQPYPFTALRQFLQGQITDFGIGSTNNPPIDIFLYSHHLSV